MSSPGAFLFDANQCTGCQACELACSIENQLDGFSWRQVVTLNEERHPGTPVVHLSLACNHCQEPPCMEHCPALAYRKDPESGLVSLDGDLCIGCRYCSWACPYDAPRFDAEQGVMSKCTFCGDRQAAGLAPACVEQCPTGALGFGELADLPGIATAPGMPTLGPGPSIRFVPWRGGAVEVAAAVAADAQRAGVQVAAGGRRKISLRSEWPLVGFTLIMAALVAAFAASFAGALRLPAGVFLAAAAAGMGLSTLHLGKPRLAWRAMLNLRRSWLSREIALVSAFVGLAALCLLGRGFLERTVPWLAPAVALLGFVALYAVDRVYDLVRPAATRPVHSADVLPTGALLTALLLAHPASAVAVGGLKLALYLRRKVGSRRRGRWSALASLGRLGGGFAVPLVAAWVDPAAWQMWALAGTAIGELIDRCELYGELEVPTPRRQMAVELQARLAAAGGPGGLGSPG